MPYAYTSTIGVLANPTAIDSSPQFALGTTVIASQGGEMMYVKSDAAITANDTIHISATFAANPITTALAATAGMIGNSQVSCSVSGQYFWALLNGNWVIRVAVNCQPSVPLYTTDVAGVLDDATASLSHFQVQGVEVAVGLSNSAAGVSSLTAFAKYPIMKRPLGT